MKTPFISVRRTDSMSSQPVPPPVRNTRSAQALDDLGAKPLLLVHTACYRANPDGPIPSDPCTIGLRIPGPPQVI